MIDSKTFDSWKDVINFLNTKNLKLNDIQILPYMYEDLEFGIVSRYIIIYNVGD